MAFVFMSTKTVIPLLIFHLAAANRQANVRFTRDMSLLNLFIYEYL